MEEMIKSVFRSMSSVKLPQKKFILSLLTVLSLFQGKATFRNMSRYSGYDEKTFSRWYRKFFAFTDFNRLLLTENLLNKQELIAVIDASFMNKSGRHTEGLGWFYSGCAGKSIKGLEISTIAVVDMAANTAYSLDTRQTLDTTEEKTDAEETRITQYADQVINSLPHLKALGITYLAQDAFYSKKKFVAPVCKTGLHVVGKLRGDANLKYLYTGKHQGRGRPKKFAGKVDVLSELSSWDQESNLEKNVQVYSKVVWSVCFKRKIKVVILRRQEGDAIGQAILFSTDLNLSTEILIGYYKARFQIEFVFRDAKQYTGLMDCQALRKEAIHTHVNASLLCLNLLKLEDRKHGQHTGQKVISIATWKRKKFNQQLIEVIFDKLGVDQKSHKISDIYRELSDYGAIAA